MALTGRPDTAAAVSVGLWFHAMDLRAFDKYR
ncbi:MAG: hypothetical protein RLZZ524_2625 [Pseudomonadota bacterium]|jgi:hypothetical protein